MSPADVDVQAAALRRRHATVFHAMVVATFFTYAPFWWAIGFRPPAVVCVVAAAAVALNAARCLLTRSRRGYAQVGMVVATACIITNSLMVWREVPLVLAWSMFGPVFGWILGSPRQAVAWFGIVGVLLIGLVVAARVGVLQVPLPALTDDTRLLLSAVNAAGLGAVALVAIVMLTQHHQIYLSTLGAQQASLAATNQRLATAHAFKDRFFAAVSHELRTPMNAIAGTAELLAGRPDADGEARSLLSTMRSSSSQLLHIIDDLLDLTQVRENRLALVTTDFELAEALQTALTRARAAHPPAPGVQVAVDVAPCERHVRGDRQRLIQIAAHLMTNAFKFTQAGTVAIHATWTRDGHGQCRVQLTIRDSGIGIAADALANLLDESAQAPAADAPRAAGVGVGLALASRLATLMGGGLAITSAVGSGTQVVVAVTLGWASREALSPPAPLTSPAPRILVVDDNRVNVMVTVKMLARLVPDATVTTAADGAEAIDEVVRARFDLVLMDMQMPVVDGATATRRIRALAATDRSQVPIVAVTANAGSADLQACLDAGMDHALTKPVAMASLATVLGRFLPGHATSSVDPAA